MLTPVLRSSKTSEDKKDPKSGLLWWWLFPYHQQQGLRFKTLARHRFGRRNKYEVETPSDGKLIARPCRGIAFVWAEMDRSDKLWRMKHREGSKKDRNRVPSCVYRAETKEV